MVGLNDNITVSFLIIRHTKFAPDWCFGLLKRAFRRTKVGCFDDIVQVVESAEVNDAQLVGAQDGTVIVPTYNWADYFDPFFKQAAFKGIKLMHHMRFSKTHHGKVLVKNSVDSQEREISLLRDPTWSPDKKELPPIIPPPGLSLERRKCLFEKIQDFCLAPRMPSPSTRWHHQLLRERNMATNSFLLFALPMHSISLKL